MMAFSNKVKMENRRWCRILMNQNTFETRWHKHPDVDPLMRKILTGSIRASMMRSKNNEFLFQP